MLLASLLLHEEPSRDRARDLLLELLEHARGRPEPADISITLAAIRLLGRHELNQHLRVALARFGRVIADFIIAGAARGFDLAFSAFAGVGRDLQYNNEALFFEVLAHLPDPDPGVVREDRERAAWGDILLSAAKAEQGERREQLLREAVAFYLALERPSPFHLQQLGQAHVQLGEYDHAARVLGPLVRDRPNPWNRYWLSKVMLVHGDVEVALRLVDEAINDERCTAGYRAMLYEQRYEIRKSRSDPTAVEDLERAERACDDTNTKYKQALSRKLTEARGGSGEL